MTVICHPHAREAAAVPVREWPGRLNQFRGRQAPPRRIQTPQLRVFPAPQVIAAIRREQPPVDELVAHLLNVVPLQPEVAASALALTVAAIKEDAERGDLFPERGKAVPPAPVDGDDPPAPPVPVALRQDARLEVGVSFARDRIDLDLNFRPGGTAQVLFQKFITGPAMEQRPRGVRGP